MRTFQNTEAKITMKKARHFSWLQIQLRYNHPLTFAQAPRHTNTLIRNENLSLPPHLMNPTSQTKYLAFSFGPTDSELPDHMSVFTSV